MLGLFLNALRLLKAISRSWNDPHFRGGLVLCVAILLSGTLFYSSVEADEFALMHFRAIGQVPGGAALYFIAGRWFDWTGIAALTSTHPIAPERIRRIAEALAADPASFSHSEPFDPSVREGRVLSLAHDLAEMAALSSDERMLTLLPMGLRSDFLIHQLRRACPV